MKAIGCTVIGILRAKPEKRDKSISSAVNKIFKNFPPKP